MLNIAFHFTDYDVTTGSSSPKDQMSQWLQHAKAFGVNRIIMIDQTSFHIGLYYQHSDDEIEFVRYDTLNDAINDNLNLTWVFIEIHENSVNISNFQHPSENVVYLVGPDFGGLDTTYQPNHWVKIMTMQPKAMYAHTAMMVTLYDRLIKQ